METRKRKRFRTWADSKFTHSVFPSSVIGHISACVCETQIRFEKGFAFLLDVL